LITADWNWQNCTNYKAASHPLPKMQWRIRRSQIHFESWMRPTEVQMRYIQKKSRALWLELHLEQLFISFSLLRIHSATIILR
jgi:hypothetical protein